MLNLLHINFVDQKRINWQNNLDNEGAARNELLVGL